MRLASVVIDVNARALGRPFDYLVPEEYVHTAQIGCSVAIDFGNRLAVGYIVALYCLTSEEYERSRGDVSKLKAIIGVFSESFFDETSAQLARWISDEYLCTLPDALHLFTAPGASPKVRRVDGTWTLVHPGSGPVDDRWVFPTEFAKSYQPAKSATKQRALLDALSCGGMRVAELSLELGCVNSTLKALEKRGVVTIEYRRRIRAAMPGCETPDLKLDALTEGQKNALQVIRDALDGISDKRVIVVDGVTGSGKTEVYLRAIAKVLREDKSAIVLVPEISLTPQTVGRFRARFPEQVAVLHSRLSTGERFDQWDIIRSGDARVVVGTRSALFAPVKNLGLVIIDEEHDASYKQDSAPRYHARDVAVKMCSMRNAVLALGSATPSIETLSSCDGGPLAYRGFSRVALDKRPNGQALPRVDIVDMGKEFAEGSRSMFSRALVDALVQTQEHDEKSVLLLNKRGFAHFLLCRECGFVPQCPNCAVSLTYHEREHALICHHCDYREAIPIRCPKCESPYLRKFGAGTERVEAELAAVLPAGIHIVRMDADTTKGKGAHERLLEEFASTPRAVLLGTQMIAKGLDFPDVTLVGVINADTTLSLPDYRAPERTYQLIEQVSGRAGRAKKPGRVIVQTYQPEHPALVAAASHNRALFLADELEKRKELAYPPYVRMANVLAWGKSERGVQQALYELTLAISTASISAGYDWTILGPAPCLLSRLRGVYRWHTLVKAPVDAPIASLIAPLLEKRKRDDDVRVAVDVDPCDLF